MAKSRVVRVSVGLPVREVAAQVAALMDGQLVAQPDDEFYVEDGDDRLAVVSPADAGAVVDVYGWDAEDAAREAAALFDLLVEHTDWGLSVGDDDGAPPARTRPALSTA